MTKMAADSWLKLQRIHYPQAVRRAREGLGLTREALAGLAGVTARTISRWERGICMPRSTDVAASLAGALQARMDYLFLPDRGGPWDLTPLN